MAYRNLDEFLTRLEQAGDIVHLTNGQSGSDVSEIVSRDVTKVHQYTAPNGTRVVRNLFGTRHRVEQALRVASLNLIAERLEQLLEIGKPGALGVMISRAMTMFSAIRTTTNRRAPSEYQKLPLSQWHANMLAMRHYAGSPEIHATLLTGGAQPRMVAVAGDIAENTIIGEFWPTLGVGETVALVVGSDPAFMFAAHSPLPDIIHRSYFASWLRDKPLDMMRLPGLDIEIPSNAETVVIAVLRELNDEYTVLDVNSVWTRPNSIYPQFLREELDYIRDAFAEITLPLMCRFLPGLQGVKLRGQLGVLTVNPAKTHIPAILRQLWAVPISTNIYFWLLLPETDDIDAAVERLEIGDVRALAKLTQGRNYLGVLLDASSKPEPWESSEPDLELEQVFWHFKRNWRQDMPTEEL